MLTPTGIITPVRVNKLKRILLYVVCTAGEFVWNEGGVVPATCYLRLISQCVIFWGELELNRGGEGRGMIMISVKSLQSWMSSPHFQILYPTRLI